MIVTGVTQPPAGGCVYCSLRSLLYDSPAA